MELDVLPPRHGCIEPSQVHPSQPIAAPRDHQLPRPSWDVEELECPVAVRGAGSACGLRQLEHRPRDREMGVRIPYNTGQADETYDQVMPDLSIRIYVQVRTVQDLISQGFATFDTDPPCPKRDRFNAVASLVIGSRGQHAASCCLPVVQSHPCVGDRSAGHVPHCSDQ